MRDIEDLLEEIAEALGDRVLTETKSEGEEKPAPLPEITSAFKALCNYHAMMKKLPAPNPEEGQYGWKDAATDTPNRGSRGNGRPEPDF
jgi:hypothetical protein